ncbi:hypothetical protein AARAC_010661 [Aspergillus arachidicola]|uniref:BTB domain-containing protein n=1 Tax=Aspergillus arachidicola TaxID=656916 RepID=A0A2G7FJH5_9EURO|nr:hypothetical protein AARAC_010661 [Aspergillus arachidicola]
MSEKTLSPIQPGGESHDIERIDPDGNVILLVEGPSAARFLVSSKILSMASPVFAKLFDSRFSEGMQMAYSTCPTISLHEDDTAAMRTIIRILHYQDPMQDNPITAEAFAILAIHCNKYDCIRAITPWTFKWFNDYPSIATAEEHGYLLLAAHFFRSAEQFSRISASAQALLRPDFSVQWDVVETLDLLPDGVGSLLVDRIEGLLYKMHLELQDVEERLRNNQRCYVMDGLICADCGRTLPSEARQCRPCKNTDLIAKYCSSDRRIAEYFAALKTARLWPSVEPFRSCSAAEIASRISQAKLFLRHSCQASYCPLKSELDKLVMRVTDINRNIKGLDLYPLQ